MALKKMAMRKKENQVVSAAGYTPGKRTGAGTEELIWGAGVW